MTEVYSKIIWNPYEVDGFFESSIDYYCVDGDLSLNITYTKIVNDKRLVANRKIVFKYAPFFIARPFPGNYGVNSIVFAGKTLVDQMGMLLEFINSQWANECILENQRLYGASINFRHFSIVFLNENMFFDVLAKDVFIFDENIVES
jgi:hypothetical protein